MNESGISIIIPTQDSEKFLLRFLSNFFKINSYQTVEFIIIDHASKDQTRKIVTQFATKAFIRVIQLNSQQSILEGFNKAAIRARYPHLLFLSCGINYTDDVLPAAMNILDNPSIGAVSIRLENDPHSQITYKSTTASHSGIALQWNKIDHFFCPIPIGPYHDKKGSQLRSGYCASVSGDFLICRRSDFVKIGGFNDNFESNFGDVELCLRLAMQLNLKSWCINDVSLQISRSNFHSFLFSKDNKELDRTSLVDFKFLTRDYIKKFSGTISDNKSSINVAYETNKGTFPIFNSQALNHRQQFSSDSIICGKFDRYPLSEDNRMYEGGIRLNDVSPQDSNMPLVSVITVVYNKTESIEKCITSVIAQSYTNIEHIIIDGASNDGTLEIIKRYENSLAYIISENDKGIYHAMNKGLLLAKGDYIAFLNADDYYLSHAIKDSIDNISKNNLDISYAGLYFVDRNGRLILADEGRDWDDAMLIEGIPGGHETFLVHKNCFNMIGGFDEKFRIVADYHWCMRAYNYGFKAKPLRKTILVMNAGGASFNETYEKDENLTLLKDMFGDLSDDMLKFLYKLKFYKHWYGFNLKDFELITYLAKANNISKRLQNSLFLTAENRKKGLSGKIRPINKSNSKGHEIAVVLSNLSNIAGGAERIAIETANELARLGNAVTVVSCQGIAGEPFYRLDANIPYIDLAIHPYQQEYIEKADGFELDYNELKGRKYNRLDFTLRPSDVDGWNKSHHLWKIKLYKGFFSNHKFDIIISHMPSTYTYVLLGREDRDNALHIAALHNAPEFKFYSKHYPAEDNIERYLRLVSLEKADLISVLFDQFRHQLPESYRNKCFTLPNYLSSNLSTDTLTTEKTKKKIILSVGRLVPQKDHETLLRAFSIVNKKHKEWALNIYGEGPLKNDLLIICHKLKLNPDKIFKGITHNIEEIYKTAEIFVFPSKFEGFGLTVIEAMRFGLPCLAFDDCEGVKYIIRNHVDGILVSSRDKVSNLANAISQVIESPDIRKAISIRAVKKAQEFTISNHINSLMDAINDSSKINSKKEEINENCNSNYSRKIIVGKKKKIALLSTYLEGGAGIAAERLCNGLRKNGFDSKLISLSNSDNKHNYQMALPYFSQKIFNNCLALYKTYNQKTGGTLFSASYPSLSFDQLSFLQYFDLINLHWVPRMLSNEAITFLANLGKPIVWTLHDMNPFTGGCHYSNGCKKYETDCRSCPQLHAKHKNYPTRILEVKKRYWPNEIFIVTPSKWLADCAAKSQVFGKNPKKVIANGVDTNIFHPLSKDDARKYFNLPLNKKIILFTCYSHAERRKGFRELVETTDLLAHFSDQLHVITFGNNSDELNSLKLNYTALGHISDEKNIAIGYSAADLTVLPSLEDNLPNVILESVSCGTPVVAFDSGGIKDAIVDGVTGYTVPKGDCLLLAKYIAKALFSDLSANCRKYALRHFSIENQANSYSRLFEEIIDKNTNYTNYTFYKEINRSIKPPTVFNEMNSLFYDHILA